MLKTWLSTSPFLHVREQRHQHAKAKESVAVTKGTSWNLPSGLYTVKLTSSTNETKIEASPTSTFTGGLKVTGCYSKVTKTTQVYDQKSETDKTTASCS